ncbi:hypothetical protein FIBSPDRAFT_1038883 [Athelia psychrophila]|uniref:Uncharacterized protein n=1 Tax=Athelia psychrophila TaxID=1759441 RepID=A0A166SLQ0_9AGAM|nr:hypothetical protein FIBSPDRAFT_1038883 [Fibularhizoctonia sp. CBS 109695]
MASIGSPPNPEVPLKCYTIPYGVLGFTISLFMLCYDASNKLGYNIWTPWILSPKEIQGPLSLLSRRFTKSSTIPYRAILGVRDAVRLVGCCVAFAVSTYTVYECGGSYRLTGIWRMTDAFARILMVSSGLYIRNIRSTPNFLVSVITIFLAVLYGLLRIAGPIVGLIGLKNIAQGHVESHPSLRIVAYVLLSIGLTLVISLTAAMSIGSFSGKERLILQLEGSLLRRWLTADETPTRDEDTPTSPKSDMEKSEIIKKREGWLKGLKDDGGSGGGALEWTQSVRRSSGVFHRVVTIVVLVLGWSIVFAVYFEGWYIDWMLAVVTDNIPGVPYHRALGIVYAATAAAYTLI